MGHKAVFAAGSLAAALAALMLTSASAQDIAPQVKSQTPPAAADAAKKPATADAAKKPATADAAKKKDVTQALKAYDAGTRAYESGKLEPAIQSLSTALSSGGLQSQQMAKALYYRGAAYRKQGKPAQAISDLTTAVWLKNGLSDSDRALAIDQRQGAYREAGLGDSAPPVVAQKVETTPAAATPAPAPVASVAPGSPAVNVSNPGQSSGGLFSWLNFGGSPAPAAPAPAAAVAPPAPPAAAVSSWSTTEATAPQAPAQVAMAAPAATMATAIAPPAVSAPAPVVSAPIVSAPVGSGSAAPSLGFAEPSSAPSVPVQTSLNAVPTESDAAAPSAATSTGGPATLAEAGKAVTGFFGNLFSGVSAGSQATAASSSPVATSSTAPAAATEWGQATSVTTAKAAPLPAAAAPAAVPPPTKVAAVAADAATPTKVAAVAAPAGRYRLQVAAVRSRDEASGVAARLVQGHAGSLGARQPEIDEAVIGNMGTFYRVRVGPYANAQEPGQLCSSLRPKGFDCMVVTQ